jgi:transposase
MVQSRRTFTREFKFQIIREIELGATVAEISRRHDIHPTVIHKWYRLYKKDRNGAFGKVPKNEVKAEEAERRIAELERLAGRLAMENDILKKALKALENISDQNNGAK